MRRAERRQSMGATSGFRFGRKRGGRFVLGVHTRFSLSFCAGLGLCSALLLTLGGCAEQDLYQPPDSPFEITGRVAVPGEAMDVAALGDYAYVAMEQGGLQSVDISDPSNPRLSLRSPSDQRMKRVVAAQTYDGDGTPRKLAFAAIGTEGLGIFDVTSGDSIAAQSIIWNGYYTENLHLVPPKVVTEPFTLFLADGRRGLAFAYQDTSSPGSLEFYDGDAQRTYTEGHAMAVTYVDDYAYVADDQMGVSVVDATTIDVGGSLKLIGNLDTPGEAVDIATDGEYLFVADSHEGLHIMRIGNDHLPELVGSFSFGGDCLAVAVRNGVAFAAAEDAGLYVLDVRNPEQITILGSVPTSDAVGVAVSEHDIVCVADSEDGLIVFRNPGLPSDFTPPAAVSDLKARLIDVTSLELIWTAPGDDGSGGTAALYDLRWSHEPINALNWDDAASIHTRPLPHASGARESVALEGLTPGERYYFMVHTCDEAGNWSALSNQATVMMFVFSLTEGSVRPEVGDPSTIFTFSVVYTHTEELKPLTHDVLIDGTPYEMTTPDTSADHSAGVTYSYTTSLGLGCHEYLFSFEDEQGLLLRSELAHAPRMEHDPFDFTLVPINVADGVTFAMGSPTGELGRDTDEVLHDVTLTRPYYISNCEVTQDLYAAIMSESPSWFQCDSRPVECVSWYEAVLFCNALSTREGYDPAYYIADEVYQDGVLVRARVTWNSAANGCRLPTEAEWEYACRAGASTSLANGDLTTIDCELDAVLDAIGWYCGNSALTLGPKTRGVRSKSANDLGLHDTHGNVWEWCWDQYAEYPPLPITDPTGADGEIGDPRVRRGGHWESEGHECRSASREWFYPNSADHTTGFRIARNAE